MNRISLFAFAFFLSTLAFSQEREAKNNHLEVASGLILEAFNSNNYGMSFSGVLGDKF
ncbi:hypothetical protein [Brumimicrobium oceani]|uniref:hypothetical protein n=1 Tax=Brumimicrobium oceani TaxID=2100725 RepID=UPI001304BBD1|nr:hypothetical protein [Brumimicrobium oceani]